jgi:hypothetical protein
MGSGKKKDGSKQEKVKLNTKGKRDIQVNTIKKYTKSSISGEDRKRNI